MALALDGTIAKPYPLYPTTIAKCDSLIELSPVFCVAGFDEPMKLEGLQYCNSATQNCFLPYLSSAVPQPTIATQNFQFQSPLSIAEHFSTYPQPESLGNTSSTKNKHGRMYNPGRPLAMADRQRILQLYEKGHKISHIARIIGVTHSCVSKIMTRYRRTGSMHPRSTSNGKQRNLGFTAMQIDSNARRKITVNVSNDSKTTSDTKVPLPETALITRPFASKSYSINSILYES